MAILSQIFPRVWQKKNFDKNPVVAREDALFLLHWLSRSSKVDDFHLIRNMAEICMTTYSLELSTENCGQTAADRDMFTVDSLLLSRWLFDLQPAK